MHCKYHNDEFKTSVKKLQNRYSEKVAESTIMQGYSLNIWRFKNLASNAISFQGDHSVHPHCLSGTNGEDAANSEV